MPRPSKGARLWFDKTHGFWVIRDGTSKRGTGCRSDAREEAERALARYIAEKYRPANESQPDRVMVSDVLLYYLREIVPHQRSKANVYACEVLAVWWHGKSLADVKRSTCQAYIQDRTAQTISQAKTTDAMERKVKLATAGRELSVLRAAIHAYHAETPLSALPVVFVPPPAPARTRWLTRDEAARLILAARRLDDCDASRALIRFILIGLYTGTRSGAIRELRWEPGAVGGWVDLRKGIIHRRSEDEAETKKRKPPVRIPRRIKHFLERWQTADKAIRAATVIHYKGRPVQEQRDAWRAACKVAGLGTDVTAHILRHTSVTWMLGAGVGPWDVANYAGMTIQMLEEVYGHHAPEFQAGAADKVGRHAGHRAPAASPLQAHSNVAEPPVS